LQGWCRWLRGLDQASESFDACFGIFHEASYDLMSTLANNITMHTFVSASDRTCLPFELSTDGTKTTHHFSAGACPTLNANGPNKSKCKPYPSSLPHSLSFSDDWRKAIWTLTLTPGHSRRGEDPCHVDTAPLKRTRTAHDDPIGYLLPRQAQAKDTLVWRNAQECAPIACFQCPR
jgi:hypothetical protein